MPGLSVSTKKTVSFFNPFVYSNDNAINMAIVHLLQVLSIGAKITIPFVSKKLLTDDSPESQMAGFVLLAGALVVPVLLERVQRILLVPVTSRVQRQLTERMHETTFRQPYTEHVSTPTGEFAQGIASNYGPVSGFIPSFYGNVAPFLVESVVIMGALALEFGVSAVIVPGIVAFYTPVFLYGEKKYRERHNETLSRGYESYGVVLGSVDLHKIAKQFDRVGTEKKRVQPLMIEAERLHKDEDSTREYTNLAASIISYMGFCLGAIYIFIEHSEGRLNDLDFLVINFLLFNFSMTLNQLTPSLFILIHGIVDAERIIDFQTRESGIEDRTNAIDLNLNRAPTISLRNVVFSYPDPTTNTPVRVLNGISCEIAAGRTVAFVGRTGAGKSTLTQLLQRFYPLTSGTINIDDQDISGLTARSLHHHCAVVEQGTDFVPGSLYDNIAYARADATDLEIVAVAQAAGLIQEGGLQALNLAKLVEKDVGIKGNSLSGGEKQRIAIARAILKGGLVLILDEATSALDPMTARGVQDTLNQLSVGVTTIIITHNLLTLAHVDCVYYLENGVIAEQGTCSELISQRGLFYSQIATQLQEQGNGVTPEIWLDAVNLNPPNTLDDDQRPMLMRYWKQDMPIASVTNPMMRMSMSETV